MLKLRFILVHASALFGWSASSLTLPTRVMCGCKSGRLVWELYRESNSASSSCEHNGIKLQMYRSKAKFDYAMSPCLNSAQRRFDVLTGAWTFREPQQSPGWILPVQDGWLCFSCICSGEKRVLYWFITLRRMVTGQGVP